MDIKVKRLANRYYMSLLMYDITVSFQQNKSALANEETLLNFQGTCKVKFRFITFFMIFINRNRVVCREIWTHIEEQMWWPWQSEQMYVI